MLGLAKLLNTRDDRWYLIGCSDQSPSHVMDHEVCHGLFYTLDEYREKVLKQVGDMPSGARKKMTDWLAKRGYDESVFDDEINAYLSTGIPKDCKGDEGLQAARCKLRRLFNKYKPDPRVE